MLAAFGLGYNFFNKETSFSYANKWVNLYMVLKILYAPTPSNTNSLIILKKLSANKIT